MANGRYAFGLACLTACLLAAGALVTSTGSGLSVPDWPLSFGQFFPPMIGGVLYEHGHRLIAGAVALCTAALALRFAMTERRRWVRFTSYAALGIVIAQATLGGLTVLFKLPTAVSVAHACLAQLFFVLTVVMALATSPTWENPLPPLDEEPGTWVGLPKLCLVLSIGFFCQLLLGAVMRHMGAGLAIPDFPAVFGGWVPSEFPLPIAIHFAHRMGAYLLIGYFAFLTTRLYTRHGSQLRLIGIAGILAALLSVQVLMGAMVIWLRRPVPLTTAHLVVGALCLATSVVLTIQVYRAAQRRTTPLHAVPFSKTGRVTA